MIHLDTSFLIRSLELASQEDLKLQGWLRDRESVAMSSVAWSEFLCGPLVLDTVTVPRFIQDIVSFSLEDSAIAAHLFNISGRRRGSFRDCMIAATAIRAKAALATSDVHDFKRFEKEGLRIA